MATTKYTGYTSSNLPATVTTTPVSTPTPSPVVDATKIGTTATTPVPTPPAPVVNPNQATQIANYTASSADTATSQEEQKLQAEADAQKARAQSQMTDLAQAQSALGGKAGDLATAYGAKDETGQSVNTLAAQLRQLNAQAQGIQLDTLAKQQAEMNKATGQNITQQAVTRNTADATRENLINMATIGIKSAIAKADYDTAKSYADQIVEAKYSGMEADLASKKTQLEWAMQQDLAPAQKKLADEQARKIEKDKQDLVEKRESEKMASEMIINARGQGAPQNIADKAQKILEEGGSKLDVARALGVYGGDFLRNELTREQLKQARTKTSTISSEGRETVTENGVQLVKVTPKEIQDLNDTQIAKNSLVSLVDNMINSIDKYGTQVLFGAEAGTRSGVKTNLLLAMKNLEKTGALDKGTIDVLSGTIPDNEFFATEAAQKAALQQLKNTVLNKTDEYISSYKGTTAEVDPRTKRIYAQSGTPSIITPQGVSTAGASYAQSSMSVIGNVNNQVNTQQSYSGYDTGIK